jgi:hypothetical protein
MIMTTSLNYTNKVTLDISSLSSYSGTYFDVHTVRLMTGDNVVVTPKPSRVVKVLGEMNVYVVSVKPK